MLKAVFLDYTGTLMQEESPYALQMVKMITDGGVALKDKSVKEVIKLWWSLIKNLESGSYLDDYLTEDEIVDRAVAILESDYDVKIDLEAFRALAHKFWSSSPAFGDVKPFFEKCPLPIYIITNNGEEYVSAFLKNNGLHCAGIVCGDMVKAYKPRKELFGKALEISGCDSHEVIHVGDSLQSDVQGAMSVGIKACLLDRKAANTPANTQEGYVVCSSLTETLTLL